MELELSLPLYLKGELLTHRRGKIFKSLLQVEVTEEDFPDQGICLMFATEYQSLYKPVQEKWGEWIKQPGRLLLLIPPFHEKEIGAPVDWFVEYRMDTPKAEKKGISRLLAKETQFVVKGNVLQCDRDGGHCWSDHSLNTAFYRPHSHSGCIAATVLPLWSVTLIDQQTALLHWLSLLAKQAGLPPVKKPESSEALGFIFRPEHHTLLVHLWSIQPTSKAIALEKLEHSKILQLAPVTAKRCFEELEQAGLWKGERLKEQAELELKNSPYWIYAEVLREDNQ